MLAAFADLATTTWAHAASAGHGGLLAAAAVAEKGSKVTPLRPPSGVTRMLLAGTLSALLVIGFGGMFITWLRKNEFGQNIREDGPQGHIEAKAGTPTMGGLLIFAGMTGPYFAIGRDHTHFGFTLWLVMMCCAAIGFWDDLAKIMNRRSLGLPGRVKMLLLGLVSAMLGFLAHNELHLTTDLVIPFTTYSVHAGWLWYPLLFLVITGASNAVNLTDGLDGLASGAVAIALFAYMAICFIVLQRQLGSVLPLTLGPLGALDVAIFCAALAGACVGFLWHNTHPAHVFMGDTGSLGLGGALAALAVVTKTELLLIVIGGLFVVETLSVMLQVVSFKRTGKRIFLMAPIHHHFELMGWSEPQIMVRFWIVAGLFAGSGFTFWFRTH
jgi:phospho-N-acetylmuramoyl-pentapeptide-transferase